MLSLVSVVQCVAQAELELSGAHILGGAGGTLQLTSPTTTPVSLTWGASTGQILRSEGSELAIGLLNEAPYPIYAQGRTNLNRHRTLVLNPLGGMVTPGPKRCNVISAQSRTDGRLPSHLRGVYSKTQRICNGWPPPVQNLLSF